MEEEKEKSTIHEVRDKAKAKWKSFKKKLWNSEKSEFFGRTASSWAKILTFYFVFFYPLLFAFWCCMMLVLMQTLSNDEPKYKLEKSLIGSTPGIGYRPTPPTPPHSMQTGVIWMDSNRPETTKDWVSNLKTFLEPYYGHQKGTVNCTRDEPTDTDRVCFVPVSRKVAKVGKHSCTEDGKFGYEEGKPCILLKLNRIYGWIPKIYDEATGELNNNLKEEFEKGFVYVTCIGETQKDRDNLGDVDYFPKQGIPSYYYPFTNQKGYMSPFVFVQFGNLKRGVVVEVRCRAWFKNIGSTEFEKKTSVLVKLRID